ncbi:MAG: ATP-binding protein [Leptolyngbyaceae cyanobacterium RU_5_1]|nr:ATP-binding protein [Leptolyngbyaceae cyanobacterium RU_5_1]
MQTSNTSADVLLQQAASLLVYQSVLASEVGQVFLALLAAIAHVGQDFTADKLDCLHAYGRWFSLLADRDQSWQDCLITSILQDDNPFTRQAQLTELEDIPTALVAAARHDLRVLQQLARCNSPQLSAWVMAATQHPTAPVVWKPNPVEIAPAPIWSVFWSSQDWAAELKPLVAHYHKHGVGLFAEFRALRWQAGQCVGIAHPDRVQIADLMGYEAQRDALLKNTEFLLNGYPALHVLLYGSRGSGKSSLVKALLNPYGDRGLRLIEVAKSDLRDLPAIADRLRPLPQKFILFVDDLSFEEDEDTYKALKVVLEGSLTARPQNVVVYATSNRRHLIREFFGDRPRPQDSDEVHAWDTVQEKLSFSDRFGLTLTFEPPDQPTYLQIIHHLAHQVGISLSNEELEHRALQWATRHNGRSGRTARQFIDFLQADLALYEQS